MNQPIIAFGELLWDVFPTGEVLGGAPANFAFRIKELGRSVHLVSRLGDDDLGKRAVGILQDKNLPTDFVQGDEKHSTGSVPVTVDAAGVPEYTILPNVAYDFIEPTSALERLFSNARAICFGTLIQRSAVSRSTLHKLLSGTNALKILDLNLRKDCSTNETIDASLRQTNILKLNESEAGYLANIYALNQKTFPQEAVQKWNLNCCVVTLGPEGAIAATSKETVRSPIPSLPGAIVDTVGCGDAFTAMFVHRWLEGAALKECCDSANMLGAKVARTRGGMEPVSI